MEQRFPQGAFQPLGNAKAALLTSGHVAIPAVSPSWRNKRDVALLALAAANGPTGQSGSRLAFKSRYLSQKLVDRVDGGWRVTEKAEPFSKGWKRDRHPKLRCRKLNQQNLG